MRKYRYFVSYKDNVCQSGEIVANDLVSASMQLHPILERLKFCKGERVSVHFSTSIDFQRVDDQWRGVD